MLVYLYASFAACANAVSSVLQRKADAEEPFEENLSPQLIRHILVNPTWLSGFLAIIAGFLLQATALRNGPLAVVQPILILELPVTLVLAARIFHRRLGRREWTATLAITFGLAGVLYFLAPAGGTGSSTAPAIWGVGIAGTLGLIGGLVAWARRSGNAGKRAALLGVATGTSFGLTAAFMKAMTNALSHGFLAIFLTWQTYAMIVAGALALFLLQSSLNAGPLVAAQPGVTAADPVVAVLWGVLAFHEQVRGGIWLFLVLVAAGVAAWGVVKLSRSSIITGATPDAADAGDTATHGAPEERDQRRAPTR